MLPAVSAGYAETLPDLSVHLNRTANNAPADLTTKPRPLPRPSATLKSITQRPKHLRDYLLQVGVAYLREVDDGEETAKARRDCGFCVRRLSGEYNKPLNNRPAVGST